MVDGSDLGGTRGARPPEWQNKSHGQRAGRNRGTTECWQGQAPGNWGDNLGGDWFSRLGPAGTRRSRFIGRDSAQRETKDGGRRGATTRAQGTPGRTGGAAREGDGRPGDVGVGLGSNPQNQRAASSKTQSGEGAESDGKTTSFREKDAAIEQAQDSVFYGRKQEAGRRCGRGWRRGFAVGVGSPAGRELGRNSFQPEVGRLLSWSLCRMFLLSGRQGDGQRQRQRAWWVQDAAR